MKIPHVSFSGDESNNQEEASNLIDRPTRSPPFDSSATKIRRRRKRGQKLPRLPARLIVVVGAPLMMILLKRVGIVFAYIPSGSFSRVRHPTTRTTRVFHLHAFDPKEEIWPPTNEDTVINLEDSFIGGALPKTSTRTSSLSTTLSRPVWIRILPAILLIAYTIPHIQPIDGLLTLFFSGYICVLAQWSKPSDGGQLTLPSEPVATGRIPLLDRPLGPRLSIIYENWQAFGGWIGLVLPWCLLASGVLGDSSSAAMAAARPLYFLACQAVTETAILRLPLPIRVLVSFVYAILRLVSVYAWFTTAMATSTTIDATVIVLLQQALASIVLVYTLVHLVAVVPVVALRYLRVHFFLVEAASVELRPGMEASMGFSPSDNDDGTS